MPLRKPKRHKGRWLAKLPPDPEQEPHWIHPLEHDRLKRFAMEKSLWVGRNFRPPPPDPDLSTLLALWTWGSHAELRSTAFGWTKVRWKRGAEKPGWILLGFRHIKMTPKRIRKWRRQVGLKKGDPFLIASLAGGPPTETPFVHNPVYKRLPKAGRGKAGRQGKRVATDRLRVILDPFRAGALPTTRRQVEKVLRQLEMEMGKRRKEARWYDAELTAVLPKRPRVCSECSEPALYLVGYTYRGHRRIVQRCSHHAWRTEEFPETARGFIRIYRPILPPEPKRKRRSA